MIEIKHLHFAYKKDISVLNGINLKWEESQIHGLMGSNGSGKSTLFKCLKGLQSDFQGEILVDGNPLKKEDIAFLPAENYFYPRMLASEYLHFFKISNPHFDPVKWCDIMDLPTNGLIDNFSTGMKKKLAIIGSIGLDKPVLILDEPFNGLDAESFQLVQELMLSENEKGKTIILSSHISSSLRDICNDIAYLENGAIKQVFQKDQFDAMDKELFQGKREEIRRRIDT